MKWQFFSTNNDRHIIDAIDCKRLNYRKYDIKESKKKKEVVAIDTCYNINFFAYKKSSIIRDLILTQSNKEDSHTYYDRPKNVKLLSKTKKRRINLLTNKPHISNNNNSVNGNRQWRYNNKKKKYFNSLSLMLLIFISNFITILFMPTLISSDYINNNIISQQSKNSGQFFISQLCAGKSQFPVLKKVEGAVLTSVGDSDVNCTITFKTKSARQHFAIRFEELKLGCDDHLKLFDGDLDYGQPSIKDFSCKDSLASVPLMKTTGTFLTLRFSTDSRTHKSDGFRLILTAIFDTTLNWDCPADYSYCQNRLCISRSLFCDDVNHCLDNSDEVDCSSRFGGIMGGAGPGAGGSGGRYGGPDSFYDIDSTIKSRTFLIVVIISLVIVCVMLAIFWKCFDNRSHYNQYQHHLQRTIGVPLQTSASLMFANPHQLQYQYFQPTNLSPYVTPQHHATLTNSTLTRGYSTLPLNLARANPNQQAPYQLQNQPLAQQTKQGQLQPNNTEYLMMAGLTPATALQAAPTMQTNLFMPTSQSFLATSPGIRYQPTTLTQAPIMAPQQQQPSGNSNMLKQQPKPVTTSQQDSRR